MKKTISLLSFSIGLVFFIISCTAESILEPEIKKNENEEWLSLVNTIRIEGCECGTSKMPPVPSLVWNELLVKSAMSHSNDMNTKNFFSHISSDGKSLVERVNLTGYKWTFLGENILKSEGFEPSKYEVIESWKNSPTHCLNLMNPKFKEMGIAKVGFYWTQNFGSN